MNILLATFIYFNKSERGGRGPRNPEREILHIQEEFGFDDSQLAQFKVSRDHHFEAVESLRTKLNSSSESYYIADIGTEQRDSLNQVLIDLTQSIYRANKLHFDDIRSICRPDQRDKIGPFIKRILNRGRHKRRKPRKKR